MNLGEIKKDKPSTVESSSFTPSFQDFGAMNSGMNPFPIYMFNQMLAGAMQFPGGMQFPYMMGQQSLPPVKQSQGYSRNKQLNVPMVSIQDYNDINAIKENFECLRDLHDPKFRFDTLKDADFYIIRSSNDDDFHKVLSI